MLRAFADLGFRWKIALPILLLAVLLVAMGTLGIRGINQVADSSTKLTNRFLPGISLLLNPSRWNAMKTVWETSFARSGSRVMRRAAAWTRV